RTLQLSHCDSNLYFSPFIRLPEELLQLAHKRHSWIREPRWIFKSHLDEVWDRSLKLSPLDAHRRDRPRCAKAIEQLLYCAHQAFYLVLYGATTQAQQVCDHRVFFVRN